MASELRNRLMIGPAMAALVLGAVACDLWRGGHWGLLIISLVAVAAGCREFARLARVNASRVRLAPMIAVSVLLVLEANLHGAWVGTWVDAVARALDGHPVIPVLIGLGLVWTVLDQMMSRGTAGFFANVGGSLFGTVYLGVTFNCLMRVGLLEGPGMPHLGSYLLVVFLAATKCGDIAAFTGGKLFGRNKMCPSISPGKTWEGFAASFVGSVGGTLLFAWLIACATGHAVFAHWWQAVLWGLVLGPLGVAGDLAESCMKREASVKDSGRSLPGFGGFLDILDALVLAAPVAYALALAF